MPHRARGWAVLKALGGILIAALRRRTAAAR
jgi:hypothetical protein